MTSLREYLEHFMGHGPQVAAERIRVTEALEVLPAIEDALATGELSYSAVRELTRIATPKTEQAWLDACAGKNLRQIEELVRNASTAMRRPMIRSRMCDRSVCRWCCARRRASRCVPCAMRSRASAASASMTAS